MQSMNVLSIASDARDWLATSRQPRILHVFGTACNMINERRQVLSLVTREIGDGPFNLVVDEAVLFPRYVDADSQIVLRPGRLRVGEISIHVGNARLWSARPDWEKLHAGRTEILNQLAHLSIARYEPALPHHLLTNLARALVDSDITSALTLTGQLAGLGAGLTPAGDDFIMGTMLAAWIIHPLDIAKVLADEIANAAAPLTTSLSAAWLRSTGKGQAGILWHKFFDTLISSNAMQIREAISGILAVGETSGADALAGFVRVFAEVITES